MAEFEARAGRDVRNGPTGTSAQVDGDVRPARFEVPRAAVEAAGLALGSALAAATYFDGDEEMVDWGQWHPCSECPRPAIGKCGCAGAPFATAEIVSPTLAAAAPHIAAAALRQAAEELWDRMDGEPVARAYHAWLNLRADQLDGRQPAPVQVPDA